MSNRDQDSAELYRSAAVEGIREVDSLRNVLAATREENARLREIIALALAEYDESGCTSEFPPKHHWTNAARRLR